MSELKKIDGGVTAAQGYTASGVHAGIKHSKLDLALLATTTAPATVAGVFTTNRIQGPTVRLCQERLERGEAWAVVINSGNANACVGEQGIADARRMGACVSDALGVPEDSVFVCSTGVIGVTLPMDRVEQGIAVAVAQLSEDGGGVAAEAIMTTDTVPKQAALEIEIGGMPIRIGGMTKGAGMIEPNMATMLSFITTDASVDADALQRCLVIAVNKSFNKITIDGDQSCNDTVLLLANGAASDEMLDENHADWALFCEAIEAVALDLALQMVHDAEGATKFVTVKVINASTEADAHMAVRQIANSLLVKTSWFGCDPNWGRVIDAVGHSGCHVIEEMVDISFDELRAVVGGRKSDEPLSRLEEVLQRPEFTVTVDLNLGEAQDIVYTCDCSLEYVRINSEYTT